MSQGGLPTYKIVGQFDDSVVNQKKYRGETPDPDNPEPKKIWMLVLGFLILDNP